MSLTLKAFANSSQDRGPRAGIPHGVVALRFKQPWETAPPFTEDQTLKGLHRENRKTVATPSELQQTSGI
ncbi:MAG TPA: hypothetical protein VFP47_14615 [Pyrinomonadaceae bacterium]|nr:hypothetical protein [Pyrinomonadaceae bacterium]